MPRRVTSDDDRAKILALHGDGKSRNDIARETGISNDVVSRTVRAAGRTFDRAGQVAAATRAKQDDNRAKRAQLETDLLDDAQRLRKSMWEECLVYNFGGKDNTYEEHHHDEPDHASKLKIMQAVGVAIEKALKIAEHDAGGQADDAKSILAGLGRHLGIPSG